MINNGRARGLALVLLALSMAACRGGGAPPADTFQGIIELEDRVLGFEVPGRVLALDVQRGDRVQANALLASLDDTLARQVLAARRSELAAARAQATLVSSGSRAEEVRAMAAQLRAASAAEAQ